MKTTFLIILLMFGQKTLIAQSKISSPDSMIIIEYSEINSLQGFSNTSIRKLFVIGNISYYFISNPKYELEIPDQITASVIKYKDSSYLLFNGPMFPKYGRNAYWRDSLLPMKWTLTKNKQIINGRVGYEANAYFRGRFITAYYDPTIPINDGPLKFNGLPGLIIKLFDSDKIWDFTLKSITTAPNKYKVNLIEVAGDYALYKSFYPEWDRKTKEKNNANKSVNPNCVGCKTNLPKTYQIEKDLEY